MNTRCIVVVLGLVLSGYSAAASGKRLAEGSLDKWLVDEAMPGLAHSLGSHPRFKRETIHVAILEGEAIAAGGNGLALTVRDGVHSALFESPGIDVILVQGPGDCATTPEKGYFLAVAAEPQGARGATVSLQIYDIVERRWIGGFGYRWRGELGTSQREALSRTEIADSARGLRVAPFDAGESDLLAEHLAAQLACRLHRDGNDEFVVAPARSRSAALIAGNLASRHGIAVDGHGEAVLDTRVHAVDRSLYQVWAILTPTGEDSELSAVAVSAYASRPLLEPAKKSSAASGTTEVRPTAPRLLSRLNVTSTGGDCRQGKRVRNASDPGAKAGVTSGGCVSLEFSRDPRARMFVVGHRADGSLVRLFPSACANSGVETTGSSVRLLQRSRAMVRDGQSATETFYVVVARGQYTSVRIDRLMSRLPERCGQQDAYFATASWLRDVDAVVAAAGDDVAWEAVRIAREPDPAASRPAFTGATQ